MRPTTFTLDRPGPGRLSTMARPRGGEELARELATLSRAGVDVLVCLLTDDELVELGLEGEADAARDAGLELIRMPVPDLTVPPVGQALALARRLAGRLARGAEVVVHCRAGVGRSSVLAAAVLVCEGVPEEQAWALITMARGLQVPDTEEQRAYVAHLAEVHRDLHREA